MTERENFLERWSRKKAETRRGISDPPRTPDAPEAPPLATDGASPTASEEVTRSGEPSSPSPAAPKPEFDISSLPSLDSITAATDIRGFLAPGVPQALSGAALRRAWQADPAIRDFVGLQENDWDFTNPDAVPGFGSMPAGSDIKKMIAEIFGEGDQDAERATASDVTPAPQVAANAEESAPAETATEAPGRADNDGKVPTAGSPAPSDAPVTPPSTRLVRRDADVATQQSESGPPRQVTERRRQHGGALPEL